MAVGCGTPISTFLQKHEEDHSVARPGCVCADATQVEPIESLVGTFRICQPGSSVATSLCEGEAVPKHVGLLEIRGNDFRLQAVPLSQV